MKPIKTILILALVFSLNAQGLLYAADVETNVGRVQDASGYTGTIPAGGESKGYIGSIISQIFYTSGLIKNEFITAFQAIDGNFANNIPRWDGGKFVKGLMDDDGSRVTLGGDLTVTGDTNLQNTNIGGSLTLGGVAISPTNPWPGALWSENGSNAYRNGRVGIGTSTPTQALHVTGAGRFDGGIQVDGRRAISSTNTSHTARSTNNTNYGYFEVRDDSGDRGAYFGFGNGGDRVNLHIDTADRLNISGGNVGIGVDNPTQTLEVNGSIRTGNQMHASEYCDENGSNCVDGDELGGSEAGPGSTTPGDVTVGTLMFGAVMPGFVGSYDNNLEYGDIISGYYLCPVGLRLHDTNDNNKAINVDSNSRRCNKIFTGDWINLGHIGGVEGAIGGVNTIFQKVADTETHEPYYWRANSYGYCSASCGGGGGGSAAGVRTRTLTCVDVRSDEIVAESSCSSTSLRPRTSTPCSIFCSDR